jgi:hypothetical protein
MFLTKFPTWNYFEGLHIFVYLSTNNFLCHLLYEQLVWTRGSELQRREYERHFVQLRQLMSPSAPQAGDTTELFH